MEERGESSKSQYTSLLISCLEAIKKQGTGKIDATRIGECQKAIDFLKANKDTKRDANQYFFLFKLGIELKIKSLTEVILKATKELVALGYLDGECEDNCLYSEAPLFNGKYPRRLIDGIIEIVCLTASEQDDNLQLLVIQVLLSIVTSFVCKVHDRSLHEILKALYYIHISTKNSVNFTTSKAALNQIIHISYQRMEISFWRDTKGAYSMATALKLGAEKTQSKFTILDEYMYCTVHSIVDEALLHRTKQDKEFKRYQKQISEAQDERLKEELEEKLQKILAAVPVRAAQEKLHKEDLSIPNERKASGGKYGWCFVCRNTANIFCRVHNIPLCSNDCRTRHNKMLEMLDLYLNYKEEKTKYVEDVIMLFKSICVLSQRDMSTEMSALSMKSKILSLELILAMVQNPPESIRTHPDFITQIKEHLSESIIKNSVSNEKPIFALSFSIFSALFVNFRHNLKYEIAAFIEEIFLSILDSGNSSYQHKFLVLQVFNKIAQNPRFLLEIFVNYDCDLETKNIFERIIDCLGKIAKGKYSKSEHSVIIQPEEEQSLKHMALDTMTMIVKNSHEYMVSCESASSVAKEEEKSPSKKVDSQIEQSKISDGDENEDSKTLNEEGKYEKAFKKKEIINKAVMKFNLKPKNGIKHLMDCNYISKGEEETTVKEILNFIKNTPGLDRTKIGEYFGEDEDIPKKVMHAYIDCMNFVDVPFVQAIRDLLADFRIPGESQKVDRILMKFGDKYAHDNSSKFISASAPYELSYAVMILQTTTHSPQVKQKMPLEGFLSMTRDIRRSYSIPDDFMKEIYDDIKANPLTLADDEMAKLKQESALANGIKKKQELFNKEIQHMVKKGKELIQKKRHGGMFEEVKNAEPLREMFEVAWSGMLAVFSSLFEENEDQKIWQLCLDGLLYSIKITASLNMPVELDAFVSTLYKFTSLSSLKSIKEKNLECVRSVIDIAMKDGNCLRNAWTFVLECLSQVDYLHSLSTNAAKKDIKSQSKKLDAVELSAIEKVIAEFDQTKLDSIFSISSALDDAGITDFICNMCKVSRDELEDEENPRTFMLQKLVEVTDLNMSRIPLVWRYIWKDVSHHLVEAGNHKDSGILTFVIDSLKQLAHKFLVKEELTNYQFQKDFLSPFESILENNLKRPDVVDFLINCVADLCRKCGKNLKSGWTIVFKILGLIGKSMTHEGEVISAFAILNEIIEMHLDYLSEFVEDLMWCLLQYCGNTITRITLQAFEKMSWAISELINPTSNLTSGFDVNSQPNAEGKLPIEDKLWSLFFRGMQCLFLDKRSELREKTSKILFTVLKSQKFTKSFWKDIYDLILGYLPKPLYHLLEEDGKNADYVKEVMCQAASIFADNYETLEEHSEDFIEKLIGFISTTEDTIAKHGIEINKIFFQKIATKLSSEGRWESIISNLSKILENTTPRILTEVSSIIQNTDGSSKITFSEKEVISKSVIHLNVLFFIRNTIIKDCAPYISVKICYKLLDILYSSFQFSHEFNVNVELRIRLRKAGFMNNTPQLPTMMFQEKDSLIGYFSVAYTIYRHNKSSKEAQGLLAEMWKLMKTILEEHVHQQPKQKEGEEVKGDSEKDSEFKRLIMNKSPIIYESILPILKEIPLSAFGETKREIVNLLLETIVSDSKEVRLALKDTLKELYAEGVLSL